MSDPTLKKNFAAQPQKNRMVFQHPPPNLEAARGKFVCSEESDSYARSIQELLLNNLHANAEDPTIIEFGSGSGEPVISALLHSGFTGIIHGYEINPDAAKAALQLVSSLGLSRQYVIHTASFFDACDIPQAHYLIANPPYIPADNASDLILPHLCGGPGGTSMATRILDAGYPNVCLEISSYSDPSAVIQHAQTLGYSLTRYSITELPLGIYSRQPIVMDRIWQMQHDGCAFLADDHYSVGSAFFTKHPQGEPDLSYDFYFALTDKYVTPGLGIKLAAEPKHVHAIQLNALNHR